MTRIYYQIQPFPNSGYTSNIGDSFIKVAYNKTYAYNFLLGNWEFLINCSFAQGNTLFFSSLGDDKIDYEYRVIKELTRTEWEEYLSRMELLKI